MGIAGLFTFNTFSTKLDALDLLTNKTARLETELFDIEDPKNKTDLDRLDELFLNFEDEKFDVTLGRFTFNSPLINPQDGRMKPYSSQGINTNIYFNKSTTLKLAAFNNFSPRGTIKWYSIDDVLGIYTTGVNSDGTPSGYKGFTNSNVVVATGFEQHFGKAFKLNLWDYVIQNVSNTAYLKAEFELGKNFEFGFEAQHQNKISNGGNANTANAYFEQEKSFLYGSKIGFHKNKFALSDLHGVIKRVIFPEAFVGVERFNLNEDHRNFVLKYMSMLPRESEFPKYDTTEYYDSYSKFFKFGADKTPIPSRFRIFNKTGWSYGFLIDGSYFVDYESGVEFFVSAVVYVNEDQILNDDKYETEEIGLPFFSELGDYLYQRELKRKKQILANFEQFRFDY